MAQFPKTVWTHPCLFSSGHSATSLPHDPRKMPILLPPPPRGSHAWCRDHSRRQSAMVGGSRRSALNLLPACRPQSLLDRWARQRSPAQCAALPDDPDKPQRYPISPPKPIALGGSGVSDRSRGPSCDGSSYRGQLMSVYRRSHNDLLAADQFQLAATYNPAINQLASQHESHSKNGC